METSLRSPNVGSHVDSSPYPHLSTRRPSEFLCPSPAHLFLVTSMNHTSVTSLSLHTYQALVLSLLSCQHCCVVIICSLSSYLYYTILPAACLWPASGFCSVRLCLPLSSRHLPTSHPLTTSSKIPLIETSPVSVSAFESSSALSVPFDSDSCRLHRGSYAPAQKCNYSYSRQQLQENHVERNNNNIRCVSLTFLCSTNTFLMPAVSIDSIVKINLKDFMLIKEDTTLGHTRDVNPELRRESIVN